MSGLDLLRMALGNLRRSRLRTFLTAAGVIIGIGALVSMLSFGAGMQRHLDETFRRYEAFTLLRVGTASGTPAAAPVLDDAALARMRGIHGVDLVYRDVSVPVQLRRGEGKQNVLLRAVPPEIRRFPPFDRLLAGGFFSAPTAREIILSDRLLLRMGVRDPQAAVGTEVEVITARLNLRDILAIARSRANAADVNVFTSAALPFRIAGVWREDLFQGAATGSAYIPEAAAERLGSVPFSSVFDWLNRMESGAGRSAPDAGGVFVRVHRPQDSERVSAALRADGYEVLSFLEQFGEIRRTFLAFNGVLASVGLIALVVAALGIVNTMVTAVLERTRQIGILMAIGASRADIRRMFLFESAAIGLLGGAFGVLLGWLLARGANRVGNLVVQASGVSLLESGLPPVDFFVTPWWLALGGLLFAVGLALVAALYPAGRAARMDPVRSLRHD